MVIISGVPIFRIFRILRYTAHHDPDHTACVTKFTSQIAHEQKIV